MMFGHDFYHGTIRRYVVMFGNLFNEMQIGRFDANGARIQTLNVPISYGPKQRFIERVLADPTLNRSVSLTLPRLSFSLASMNYAPARKLNSTLKFRKSTNDEYNKFTSAFAPVPYDFNFSLGVMVKNSEDGTQIIEKILPFFTPDFTVTMKVLPEIGVNLDIPIELMGISSDDTYEGDFDTSRRVLTWDLEFLVKGYLFGPTTQSGYIANVEVNLFDGLEAIDPVVTITKP
jgi:hypothetical protein